MSDFFKLSSFLTLATCTAAVVIVVNTLQSVFGFRAPLFALLVSIAVSALAYWVTSKAAAPAPNSDPFMLRMFLILLNGCLIYCSAFGIQNSILPSTPSPPPAAITSGLPTKPSFLTRWQPFI